MDAFRDHGQSAAEPRGGRRPRRSRSWRRSDAPASRSTRSPPLVEDGVQLFADAADKLLGAVAEQARHRCSATAQPRRSHKLPLELETAVSAALEDWRTRREGTAAVGGRRGAVDRHRRGEMARLARRRRRAARRDRDQLRSFADEYRGGGLFATCSCSAWADRASAPRCWRETFGAQPGIPGSRSSTRPIRRRSGRIESKIDPARTLFIVSSKSGQHARAQYPEAVFLRARDAGGRRRAGRVAHFVAITDPGSSLENVAEREGFRARLHSAQPTIGGRYSVLSDFGMVPAALIGIDVARLLGATDEMVRSCGAERAAGRESGRAARRVLGVPRRQGRDKVTIVASPGIADLGAWLEQLIAESTGKHGKGIIPVDAEPLGAPGRVRRRPPVRLSAARIERDPQQDEAVAALEQAGQPVVRIALADRITSARSSSAGRSRPRSPARSSDQSVRPARRRGEQGQDARADRRLREERRAAARSAVLRGRRHHAVRRPGERGRSAQRPATLVATTSKRTSARCRRATMSRCSPMSTRNERHQRRIAGRCAERSATATRVATCVGLRPALPAFDRARPTRAGRTAASSCRSPATTPTICRCPARSTRSASSRRRRRAATSRCWPSAAGVSCACISVPMSQAGLTTPRRAPSQALAWQPN